MPTNSFLPFPTLTTERLVLRRLSIEDENEIYKLRSDPRGNKYIDRKPCETIEDARMFIENVDQNINENRLIYWAITMADSARLVGTIGLFHFSDEKNNCELGYELLSDFQRQGIMSEAVLRVIEYGVRTIGLEEIEAFTHKDNRNSIKLLEKCGFGKSDEPDFSNPDYLIYKLELQILNHSSLNE